jgi:undecaprenyl-diphosphatase
LSDGTNAFDSAIRAWTLAHQTPALFHFYFWVSKIGSVSPLCWLAVVVALYFVYRGRRHAAASLLVAPTLAVAAYLAGKRFLPRVRPATVGTLAEATNSFPSAHSTTSAAVWCTLAFVCWREKIVRPRTALALAIIPPLLIGTSRVYLDVHWATDVLAGWTAGLLITMVAVAVYNRIPQ